MYGYMSLYVYGYMCMYFCFGRGLHPACTMPTGARRSELVRLAEILYEIIG